MLAPYLPKQLGEEKVGAVLKEFNDFKQIGCKKPMLDKNKHWLKIFMFISKIPILRF